MPSDGSDYSFDLRVEVSAGIVISKTKTVTVSNVPPIVVQFTDGSDENVYWNTPANWYINVTGGIPPYTYQWYVTKGWTGTGELLCVGATTSHLTLSIPPDPNPDSQEEITVRVVVTDSKQKIRSQSMTNTVVP
jgi:hypothetical protein